MVLRDYCGSQSCIVMHSTAIVSVDASWSINNSNQLTSEICLREAGAGIHKIAGVRRK